MVNFEQMKREYPVKENPRLKASNPLAAKSSVPLFKSDAARRKLGKLPCE